MKLVSILLGRSVRLIRTYFPNGLYLPDVIKKLQERYGFVQVPTSWEQCDVTKGVEFRHGRFKIKESLTANRPSTISNATNEIVIDVLRIYAQGVQVDTKAFVEDADLFLDDLIAWSIQEFDGIILDQPKVIKWFSSEVEVQLDNQLHSLFKKLNRLGGEITDCLKNYDHPTPAFQVSGFVIHCDMTESRDILPPTKFLVERRETQPYSSNLFYATAPLKTSDHLKLLEKLENILD